MIRGNYSLANDQRKFEKLQQSKVQNRQKRAHMMAKLEKADPARIRKKIIALEQQKELLARDKTFLASLREDWKFIRRNNLHLAQVEAVLLREKEAEQRKEEAAAKLWGKSSVYFNPELNPLGKVPPGMKNVVVSEIGRKSKYPTDSIIAEIGVTLPAGEPPRFYKEVQNYYSLERSSDVVQGTEKLTVLVPSQLRKKRWVENETEEGDNKDGEEGKGRENQYDGLLNEKIEDNEINEEYDDEVKDDRALNYNEEKVELDNHEIHGRLNLAYDSDSDD